MRPYLTPIALWGASSVGLVAALLTDGVIELASTALVAVPLLVILLRLRSKPPENSSEKVSS